MYKIMTPTRRSRR
uniref:Uncharacterized protein n=1 Tax=Anguilla anguilla TaxID=7936 RepID=A0A0E9V2H5_ANGAN